MITVGMNYEVIEGKEQEFESVFAKVLEVMKGMEGHGESHLYKDVADLNSYLIVSEWTSEKAFDDFIASGGLEGTVRKIELRHTHVRSADGRDIFIPNSLIFNQPLINYTRDGLLRSSFTVDLDYRDVPGRARELLLAETVAVPGVLEEPTPNAVLTSLAGGTVEVEVTFWVNTSEKRFSRMKVKSEVMERCRTALLAAGYAVRSEWSRRLAAGPLQESDERRAN